MSRTKKDKPGYRRKLVYNSLYKKYLHIWGDDFKVRRGKNMLSKRLRNKLKREEIKEVCKNI